MLETQHACTESFSSISNTLRPQAGADDSEAAVFQHTGPEPSPSKDELSLSYPLLFLVGFIHGLPPKA